jgi:signal transduction histidine kinase
MVEEQDRFISDSSHELRTPLTSLKSAMEVGLMDKNMTLVEAKKLIKENIGDVNKPQKLSDSLILLTKKGAKTSSQYQEISTKEIIDESIRQIKSLAVKKKIIIKTLIKNIKFKGEQDKLTNLLVILLDNAIKYSSNGKTIKIKSWKTKHFVNISVKDEGVGILDKDTPHIFDRFYRADNSRSKIQTSGYGLGLSIAKMITEEHKGSILVKSIVGQGTVFTVKLPI